MRKEEGIKVMNNIYMVCHGGVREFCAALAVVLHGDEYGILFAAGFKVDSQVRLLADSHVVEIKPLRVANMYGSQRHEVECFLPEVKCKQ